MSSSFLIVLVLALCTVTVAGAYVSWMLDQGRRGVTSVRRRRVLIKQLPPDDSGIASS